ncbi:hypothetical protein C900_04658 [Fulvivirga imtechensis AK7]|uniref:Uncharacterized protein n=1 Tax=Fulvivirga imtechensis AK7 TaxID=1237149 RepID=L8JLL1_9BACT|nr:hypothetical protein [Fulvivirga imtechensis]ELR69811.1 hypothetical protein C900_04658 [Fulvivirga imtechensis AK7]
MLKPTSTLQKYIWIDQKFVPASAKYNIGGFVEIKGDVDITLFREAVVRTLMGSTYYLPEQQEKFALQVWGLQVNT